MLAELIVLDPAPDAAPILPVATCRSAAGRLGVTRLCAILAGVLLLAQACTGGPGPPSRATPTGGSALAPTVALTPTPIAQATARQAVSPPAPSFTARAPRDERLTPQARLESPAPPAPAPSWAFPTTPTPSIRTQPARVATPVPQEGPPTAFAVADAAHLWIMTDHTLRATTDGGQQWLLQYQGTMKDIAFVDARHGWLTTPDTLLATTDGGQTWSNQYRAEGPLDLLSFVTPRQGWITVGPTLLMTQDRGTTWQVVSPSQPVHVRGFFDALHGWGFFREISDYAPPDPELAWTGDGGQTWQARAWPGCRWSKGGGQFRASGPTTAWLVCTEDPGAGTPVGVNRTTDSGRTWQSFPAQGALGAWLGDGPQAPFFLDAQHGWLEASVGSLEGLTGGSLLQATTDGGHTWQPQVLFGSGSRTAANSGLLDYRFLSPTQGYARLVYNSFKDGSVLGTRDGGSHWTAVSGRPLGPSGPFHFVDALVGVGMGLPWDSGAVLTTRNGGQSWQRIGTLADRCRPDVFVEVRDLSFPDRLRGWAVVDCFKQYQQYQLLVRTTDGGATWQQQAQTVHSGDPQWRTIAFPNGHSGYLAGDASVDLVAQSHGRVGGAGVLTTDGGTTFQQAFTTAPAVGEIRFVSAAVGWLRADGHLAATADGGQSWRPLELEAVQDITLLADGQGWVLVGPPNPQLPAILATADGGQTWRGYTFTSLRPSAISFADATHGWVRDEQNQFYATTDGGASWVPVP